MNKGKFQLDSAADLRCDVLIIGSGAGGSAVADSLTLAGRDVLMVEEGPAVWGEDAPTSSAEGLQKLWRGNGLTAALGAPPIAYAEGRCLGGGTVINSAIMQRTPPQLLSDWQTNYRIDDFSTELMTGYYDKVWKTINATLTPGDAGPPTDILRQAGEKQGWKITELERAQKHCVGTNMCSSLCPTDGKQSMIATVIPNALKRGLRLIASCRITRIDKKRQGALASGIATDAEGNIHSFHIHCDHIFVAAGAIHTPALLRRSGYTKNIGNSLQMHPTLKLLVEFEKYIGARNYRLPLAAITEFMPRLRLGGSVFTPGYFGMSLAEDWDNRQHLLPRMDNTVMYYTMVRASGRGKIRSIPGANEPLVTYKLQPKDLHDLGYGMKQLATSMLDIGAKRVYPSISHHAGWTKPADIDAESILSLEKKRAMLMTIHLFSSCPMGEDQTRCAVNSFGQLYEWPLLTIADASVIPEAPGVNPQATVMALAYRAAEAWLQRHPVSKM